MSRTLSLNVTFQDDDKPTLLDGAEFGTLAEGVEPEVVPAVLLAIAEALLFERHVNELRALGGNDEETIEALALQSARLSVVDTVMHLPMSPSMTMSTSFPI